MENPPFQGESPKGSPPKDPKDNSPDAGLSNPQADPSGESEDQAKESKPPLAPITSGNSGTVQPTWKGLRHYRPAEGRAPITKDGDEESPPAYVKRYIPPNRKIVDLNLEMPPPEPVEGHRDVRFDPEFIQTAMKRRDRRYRQKLVDGPVSLRSDAHLPPLPAPEPYPYDDIVEQPTDAPDPGQQAGNAPDPGQQAGNAADPGQQEGNAPDPLQQESNALDPGQQPADDPGQQAGNVPDPGQQANNVPDNDQQASNVPARSLIWERCVSCYKLINSFTFQFPFHTLLLTWPLSTTILGILNLSVCPLNYMPPWMIVVGLLGLITILSRLYLIYFENRYTENVRTHNSWIVTRAAESITWIFFAVQLYLFFERAPSFTPGEEHYCKPRFYKINCGVMFLTSALMIGWIAVNVGNFIYWFSRRNERPST